MNEYENTAQTNASPGAPPLPTANGFDIENVGVADADTPRAPLTPTPAKRSKKPLYIFIAIVFVATVTCGVYFGLHLLQEAVTSSSAKTSVPTVSSKNTVDSVTPASTQDTAINTSLNDIDKTLTQASADQAKADAAMSDSDQQITVPTE